jgi:hypothetical protein
METFSPLALLFQLAAGAGLAACCGLRAFLPPLTIGLAARLGLGDLVFGPGFELHSSFAWLASTPALVVFGSAVVVEVLADKIPWVDHALDAVQTAVRPLAGALVAAASLTELDPLPAAVVGLILGGSVAGGVHVAKAKTRLLSTAGTGGLASPVLSLVEDVLALAGSVLSVLLGGVAVLLLLLAAAVAGVWVLRRRRLARSGPVPSPE